MKAGKRILAVWVLSAMMVMAGAMVCYAETGWVARGNSWYYYSADGSMAANRWVITNGGQFWMNPDGTMATNRWIDTNGTFYYVGANGECVTGWQQINGNWYYFYPADQTNKFAMASDTQIDGYRVNKDGVWVAN